MLLSVVLGCRMPSSMRRAIAQAFDCCLVFDCYTTERVRNQAYTCCKERSRLDLSEAPRHFGLASILIAEHHPRF